MKQGEVCLSAPSPITGERELRVIVSSDAYNTRPGCVSVLIAEIETGTRLRPTQHGIRTDYGVVLADRIVWFPLEMVGERFGQISNEERSAVVEAAGLVIRSR
ncbi:MAG: type II toxin-antitoxin system PemK/MazF family toxin [Pseudonocardiaceae bacterium]